MHYRLATKEDLSAIMHLAQCYRDEPNQQFSFLPFSAELVEHHIDAALEHKDHFIIVAEDESGHLVGGFWGYTAEQLFSPVTFGYDAFHYILEGYRGHGVSTELLKFATEEFERRNTTMMICGANSGIDNDRAMAFYAKHGFREIGRNMAKFI